MMLSVKFCAHHSMTLQSKRLLDHVTPNFIANGCRICGYEKSLLIRHSTMTYFINYSRSLIQLLGLSF